MIEWTSCETCHTAQILDNITCEKCGKPLKKLRVDNWRDLIKTDKPEDEVAMNFGSTADDD